MSDDHSFLERQIAKGADAFRLYGLGPSGDRRTPIDTWKTTVALPVMRDEIEQRAKNYADKIGGNQAFQIVSLDGNDKEIACDVFRLQAESITGPAGLMTEPANEGGQMQQSMRHTEAMTRFMLQQADRQERQQTKMMERLMARNDQVEARLLEGIELMGKLAREDNAQQIQMIEATSKAQNRAMLAKKLGDLIPVATDAIAAKFGGKAVSDVTLINNVKEIFHDLAPSQIEQLLGMLSDTQRIRVMSVMKRIAQQEEAQKAAEAKSASTPAAAIVQSEVKH